MCVCIFDKREIDRGRLRYIDRDRDIVFVYMFFFVIGNDIKLLGNNVLNICCLCYGKSFWIFFNIFF